MCPLLGQEVDDGVGALRVELGAVGFFHPGDIAGILDDGHLHASRSE